MAIFAYVGKDQTHRSKDLVSAHENAGFKHHSEIVFSHGTLNLFERLGGGGIDEATLADGKAFATGSFYYKSTNSVDALRAFAADHAAGSVDWSRCFGHYVILLVRGDGLTIVRAPLGELPVYVNSDASIVSNSLIATALASPRLSLQAQVVQRYILFASTYSPETFFKEINGIPADVTAQITAQGSIQFAPIEHGFRAEVLDPGLSMPEIARRLLVPLRLHMSHIAQASGGSPLVTFSSGFDSRLVLALALEAGCTPRLETYTSAEPQEEAFARAIATGLGLDIKVLHTGDRARGALVENPLQDPAILRRNMFAADGWMKDGLINDGSGYYDRLGRAREGLVLHGAGGEIYRNYFYLPNFSYRPSDLLYFHGVSRPAWALNNDIEDDFTGTFLKALNLESNAPCPRTMVEKAYLYHRGRYNFGAEIQLNQRVGDMQFLFIDAAKAWLAHQVPLSMKNYGVLQAEMIRQVHDGAARYPSSYGFDFATGPTLAYRLKSFESYHRPLWLRRILGRRRAAGPGNQSYANEAKSWSKIMDTDSPHIVRYFDLTLMTDRAHIRRAASVELLCQMLKNVDVPT